MTLSQRIFDSSLFQRFFASQLKSLEERWETSFKAKILDEIAGNRKAREADAMVSAAVVDGRKAFEESKKRFSKTYAEGKPA